MFLLVAAFILNVALTRALALQRAQIAALKALGYANIAHRVALLEMGAASSARWASRSGLRLAPGSGTLIIGLYNKFFRFPVLLLQRSAVGRARRDGDDTGRRRRGRVLGASGAPCACRPPRPCARNRPQRYRRSVLETPVISRRLGAAGRMVLRNVTRHPLRASASIVGIGFAVAILMVGFVFSDAIDRLIETQFWVAERQDVTVGFVEPRSARRDYALARLPGVVAVEPQRSVAVRVSVGPSRALPVAHRRAAGPAVQAHCRSRRRPGCRCRRRASCCRRCSGTSSA